MNSADPATLSVYDAEARVYGDKFAAQPPDRGLEKFIAGLPQGARTLDLGCGVGTAASRMDAAGLDVLPLDASPGMAAEARRRFGLEVTIGTFDDVPRLGRFAGIWAGFSLLHAPRDDLPRHLGAIHAALEAPGAFVIGMKTGEGAARDRLGRLYTYVTEGELQDLLLATGFTIDRSVTGASEGLDGMLAPWIVVFAHA